MSRWAVADWLHDAPAGADPTPVLRCLGLESRVSWNAPILAPPLPCRGSRWRLTKRRTWMESRTESDRHACAIAHRLLTYTGTPDAVQISFSGSASIHIRIAHHVVGCPIHTTERDAKRGLHRFTDRLLAGMPEARAAVDDACLQPHRLFEPSAARTSMAATVTRSPSGSFYTGTRSRTGEDPTPPRTPLSLPKARLVAKNSKIVKTYAPRITYRIKRKTNSHHL
jgi:hypothetical protein